MADERCLNCNATIRKINYALGEKWMHVDPYAGFPSQHHRTAWQHCKTQVAEPRNPSVSGGDA